MAQMQTEYYPPQQYGGRSAAWSERYAPAPHGEQARDRGPDLVMLGVAAVTVGALAWWCFGPDLQRYMKVRQM